MSVTLVIMGKVYPVIQQFLSVEFVWFYTL